ncbi:MAG: hypothetical protein ACRDBG_15340, partial [Waterburya sp.]
MTVKNINPFARTIFDRNIVKYKGEFYTYLFFNEFSSLEVSRFYKLISEIKRNVEVKVILDKKSYKDTLAEIQKQIQSILNAKNSESSDEKESAVKVLKDIAITMQNAINSNRMIELDRKQSELEGKKERIIESQSGETNVSIIIRLEVESQLDAIKICDQIELKARGFGFNIEQGTYIQKMLHRAFTGQVKRYEWEHFLTLNPNPGSVVPSHLQYSLETEEVASITLDYFPTTKITDDSIYLGNTMSSKSPYFVEFGTSVKEADNVLIIGQQGSGKSATVKDKIKQLHNLGYRIIVLDPKQDEYRPVCQSCNGFEIDSSELSGINLLDLNQFDSLIDVNPMFQTILETVTGAELSKE